MNTSFANPVEAPTNKQSALDEHRMPRPDAASSYEIEVLICRLEEGDTRARAANLPIADVRADTVREALQVVIEKARTLINECLARDNHIPWLEPTASPEEGESRFVVPLSL